MLRPAQKLTPRRAVGQSLASSHSVLSGRSHPIQPWSQHKNRTGQQEEAAGEREAERGVCGRAWEPRPEPGNHRPEESCCLVCTGLLLNLPCPDGRNKPPGAALLSLRERECCSFSSKVKTNQSTRKALSGPCSHSTRDSDPADGLQLLCPKQHPPNGSAGDNVPNTRALAGSTEGLLIGKKKPKGDFLSTRNSP